jgi:hypothetical protein
MRELSAQGVKQDFEVQTDPDPFWDLRQHPFKEERACFGL